jgi:hypothetical protein
MNTKILFNKINLIIGISVFLSIPLFTEQVYAACQDLYINCYSAQGGFLGLTVPSPIGTCYDAGTMECKPCHTTEMETALAYCRKTYNDPNAIVGYNTTLGLVNVTRHYP